MQVFFERRDELVAGIWEYSFKPERPVDFVAGQYISLHLNEVSDDPRGRARTFTLTSLPSDPEITFITKHFGLQSPYKHSLQNLQVGEAAHIDDAMGDLVLPKLTEMPLVFLAGGIGMASYVSMLKELLARKEERAIFLFYALRSRREQLYREQTGAYPLALMDIVLAPNQLSAEHVLSSVPPESLFYLSGSQRFVEGLQSDFEALGIPRGQIVFDYYDGYAEL